MLDSESRSLDQEAQFIVAGFRDLIGGEASEQKEEAPEAEQAQTTTRFTYRIVFKPDINIFVTGTNPLLVLSELKSMGECTIVARTEDIPPLPEYNPEACYVSWEIGGRPRRGGRPFGEPRPPFLALPDPIDDGALEEAATALLAEHGLGRDDAREAAALAKATRSLPAVAAAREADLVYREQPFTCVLDGERVAGQASTSPTARTAAGPSSTSRPPGLSGPAEPRARYGPQLDRYRRALAALTSEPVESALCLVRDGQLVALASEPGTPRRA